jgi:hypothetical protein
MQTCGIGHAHGEPAWRIPGWLDDTDVSVSNGVILRLTGPPATAAQAQECGLEAIERLRKDLNTCDVEVEFVEISLPEGDIPQTNMIKMNGIP